MTKLLNRFRYGRFGPLVSKVQQSDDFDWSSYTSETYQRNLERASNSETRQLSKVPFRVVDGTIVLQAGLPPLEPHHQLIYETALRLQPTSVCEFGFGGGDHLANLHLLLPGARAYGYEIGAGQINLARQRKDMSGIDVEQRDMTQPMAFKSQAEMVYCNAVMMHIHGGGRHLQFLRNMIAASSRWVVFAENWRWHDFAVDVAKLGLVPQLLANEEGCAILIDRTLRVATDAALRSIGFDARQRHAVPG